MGVPLGAKKNEWQKGNELSLLAASPHGLGASGAVIDTSAGIFRPSLL